MAYDQDGGHLPVLYTFDFALLIVDDEQRVNFLDLFGAEAEITSPTRAPIEGDGSEAAHDI
jgi:hypothetical protein